MVPDSPLLFPVLVFVSRFAMLSGKVPVPSVPASKRNWESRNSLIGDKPQPPESNFRAVMCGSAETALKRSKVLVRSDIRTAPCNARRSKT